MTELTLEQKAEAAFEGLLGDRWCIRCTLCLSVAYVETDPGQQLRGTNAWKCGLCGGGIELMGKVEWDKLMKHVQESVCDARCTSARGPFCICMCHGANHGSGRTVTVSYDLGDAPQVNMPPSEEALKIVAEFQTNRDRVAEIGKQLRAAKDHGTFLGPLFRFMLDAERAVQKANRAKSHPARMKTLYDVINRQAAMLAQAA